MSVFDLSSVTYFPANTDVNDTVWPNCADVPLRISGLPVVLNFLKFHRCPEIVLKLEIVLKFYSFGQNVLKLTFVMLS